MLRAGPQLLKLDKPASSGPNISQIPKILFRFSSQISVSEVQLPDLISESLYSQAIAERTGSTSRIVSCLAALEPLARLFPNRSGRHQQAFHREVERLPALSASFAYLQPGPQLLVGRVNHTLEVGRSPRRLLRWEGPSLFGTELYYSSNGLTHSAALSKNDQRPPFTL